MTDEQLRAFIGKRLKQARGKTSVNKLAKKARIAAGTISSIENEGHNIGIETLAKAIHGCGMSLGRFFAPLATVDEEIAILADEVVHESLDYALLRPDKREGVIVFVNSFRPEEEQNADVKRKNAKPSSDRKTH